MTKILQEAPHVSRLRADRAVPHGFARRVLGMVAIVSLAATLFIPGGAAEAQLSTLQNVEAAFNTLGTTGDEWSGATYNAEYHSLLVVDDGGYAFRFQLDPDNNKISRAGSQRITVDIATGDFEGVAWLFGYTYALANEDNGRIYVAEILPTTSRVTINNVTTIVPTGITDSNNSGIEGLASDGTFFYVAKEFPPALHRFTFDGTWQASVNLTSFMADASGVAVATDGSFLVLSDQSRTITALDLNWSTSSAVETSVFDVDTFGQAEGLAIIGNDTLYVFGEDSNQTYGHWEGELVPETSNNGYVAGDANCSGDVDIVDAYLIGMISVDLEQALAGCSADANNDGTVNIADAYFAARCAVDLNDCGEANSLTAS